MKTENYKWRRVFFKGKSFISLKLCILLSVFFSGIFPTYSEGKETISSNGIAANIGKNSGYVIIVSAEANSVTLFAARELQKYIKKIIGVELPIKKDNEIQGIPEKALLVGASRCTKELGIELQDPVPEAFLIKSVGNRIVLMGNDIPKEKGNDLVPFSYFYSHKGSIFAVYEFLERFGGVCWLFPGETGEVVPVCEDINILGVDVQEHPDVTVRQFWGYGTGGNDVSPFKVSEQSKAEFSLWLMRLRQGVPVELGFRGGFAHSWGDYMEGNKYFEAHPEYYALVNGSRQKAFTDNSSATPKWVNKGWQVCTSNPEVAELFAKRICSMYKPDDEYIVSIFANDGGGYCECPSCKALDHPELYGPTDGYRGTVLSDRTFTFINAVARKVRQTHPKLQLGTCAYTFNTTPPKTVPLMEPNVLIKVAEQPESYYYNVEYRERMKRYIEEWARRVPGIFISEHYDEPDVRIPVSFFLPLILENTRMLTARRIGGISQQIYSYIACNHLDYYIFSRLLWNGQQDVDGTLRNYFEKGYGQAAPAMRHYFDFMSETFRKRQTEASCAVTLGNVTDLWLPEDINTGSAILDQALTAADSEKIKKRIEFVRCGIRLISAYREIVQGANEMAETGHPVPILKKQMFYADRNIKKPMDEKAAQTIIIKTRHAYRKWLAFLKENSDIPGLNPQCLWMYSLKWGFPQAIEAYGAITEGKGESIFMDNVESGKLTGWTKLNKGATVVDDLVRSGKKSVSINVEDKTPQVFGTRIIPLEEGKYYIATLYYRPVRVPPPEAKDGIAGDDTTWVESPMITLRFQNEKGTLKMSDGPGCRPAFITNRFRQGTTDWIPMSHVFQAPAGANKISFTITVPPGEWRIDDISVTKAGNFDMATGEMH